jgi:hypothetical protein
MTEGEARDRKREVDKEIDSLDEEIKEADENRRTAQKSLEYQKSLEGKELEEAKREIDKLDEAYKKYEAELKAKSDDRAEKARQQQALQDQIKQLAAARAQTLGAEVQIFETMAKEDARIGTLNKLEVGKALDPVVQHQYSRASCYRADLNHFWEHVRDSATALGGEKRAKELFKAVPQTFTETLPYLDKVMRDFDYGDPDLVARAVQDFVTNAQSLRAEIKSRMDSRGDGLNPTLETQVDYLIDNTVKGMMFSVATQLQTLVSEGRLTECGAGHSAQRALDEVSQRYTPKNGAGNDLYQSEYSQQQHLLMTYRRNNPRLDRCWSKMTKGTLDTLPKETKEEISTNVGPGLETWSETVKNRHGIDAETLMANTSQVLVSLDRYQGSIEKARSSLTPRQRSAVETSLLKLRAVGIVFSSSMANEIEVQIRAGRI